MAGNPDASIKENRSSLKEFIGTIATMTGDLSNISAPPFVLDTVSAVQVPSFSVQNTSIFCAPAKSDNAAERALLTLKAFLSGIRSQCYMGHSQSEGPKKPLNAFLGEIFLAKWEDENGLTQYIGEQVSHHPPVTACRIWNDEHGIYDESFNHTEMTFSGSVRIESAGLVLKSLKKHNEHYLLPIPDFKITSLLSTPSPQLTGTYYIPSTSGYMSVIKFTEKGFLGSSSDKHNFEAKVYNEEEGENKPIYTLTGSWYEKFTVHDNSSDKELETVSIEADVLNAASKMIVEPLEKQDPWESKKAWKVVISDLTEGNMSDVNKAKSQLEEGQREMRKDEGREGRKWEPLFFKPIGACELVTQLAAKIPQDDVRKKVVQSETSWTLDVENLKSKLEQRPFHHPLRPDNTHAGEQSQTVNENYSERRSEGQPLHQFDDGIDHKVGAVDDGRPAEADGLRIDIGQSPEKKHIEGITKDEPGPQAAQTGTKEEYRGSGIDGMTLKEKKAIEDMLREEYSTGNDERDYIQRKKKQG